MRTGVQPRWWWWVLITFAVLVVALGLGKALFGE